ncbi:MAG: Ni-sirohydrochlorin a,c-diamide reductive cyclase catalytic subunit [Candidatus Alkanophagales archaeon]
MRVGRDVEILHPRPNAIAAAMYTLRDLGVEAIILHGPAGCNFKTARMLEDDGVRVFTTAMTEQDYIFGGRTKLLEVLRRVTERFSFKLVGVVGTCASMIIGEDMRSVKEEFRASCDADVKIVVVEVHCGFPDNTAGAIKALEAAFREGLLDERELERQKRLLRKATEIEKERGMASLEYIPPSRGDDKRSVARELLERLRAAPAGDAKVACVLNAKKELGYVFADVLLAVNEAAAASGAEVVNIANLDPEQGLPRVRRHAENILRELERRGVKIDHLTGGLDDYSFAGEAAARVLRRHAADAPASVLVCIGNPHAVPLDSGSSSEALKRRGLSIAVTNGPREVIPLRRLGYDRVVVELDAHSKVVGVGELVESEFGGALGAAPPPRVP